MTDTVVMTIGDEGTFRIPSTFSKYKYLRKIGYGSFSAVILVKNTKTEQFFACKVVSRKMLVERNIFDRFEQEVRIMQTLKHPNIVELSDVVYQDDYIYLIMEYCSNGELFSHIISNGYLPESEISRLFRQILLAIQYIHSRNIAHRDIKPENILLDSNMNAKLADFGLCHVVDPSRLLKTPCGSPFYAPPEIIANIQYDGKKSDIWSLGVVLYTMATGSLPWTESNQTQLFIQIHNAEIHIPSVLSPPLQQILSMMLNRSPTQRPTAEQLLEMPWLMADDEDELTAAPTPLSRRLSQGSASVVATQSLKRPLIIRPEQAAQSAALTGPVASLIRRRPVSITRRKVHSTHI